MASLLGIHSRTRHTSMTPRPRLLLLVLCLFILIASASASSSHKSRRRVADSVDARKALVMAAAANTTHSAKPPTNTQAPPKTVPINQNGATTGADTNANSSGPSTTTIIAAVCGTVGGVVAVALLLRLFCCFRSRAGKKAPLPAPRQSVLVAPSMSSNLAFNFDDASSDGTRSAYRASKYGGSTPSLRQSIYHNNSASSLHQSTYINRQSVYQGSHNDRRQSVYSASSRAYSPSRASFYGSKPPSISSRKSAPARPMSSNQRPGSFIYMPHTSTLSHLSSMHPSMRAREIIPPLPLAPKQGNYVRGDATNRVINFEPTVGMGIGPFDDGTLDFSQMRQGFADITPEYGSYLTASPVMSPMGHEEHTDSASGGMSPISSAMSLPTSAPTITPSSSITSMSSGKRDNDPSGSERGLRKRAPTMGDYHQGRSITPEPMFAIATVPPTPRPQDLVLEDDAAAESFATADSKRASMVDSQPASMIDSQRASMASFTTATDSVMYEDAEEDLPLPAFQHEQYYRDVHEDELPPAPTAQLRNLLAR